MDYRQARERISRGEIHCFYLFSGTEEYLKKELLHDMISFLTKKGMNFGLERVSLSGQSSGFSELLRELRQGTIQTSLLSEGRIIWVADAAFFSSPPKGKASAKNKPATETDEMQALLGRPFSDLLLIFSVPQVDKRKKIVKLSEETGRLVEFPQIKGAALHQWLRKRLDQEELIAEEEAAYELLERAGENLTLLDQEIKKIKLYLGDEKRVTSALIRTLTPGSSMGNIFQLTEAIGGKKMEEALSHLTRLTMNREPPLVILAMIIRQFRLLLQLSLMQEKKTPRRDIIAKMKIQPFLLDKLELQVKNYTPKSLAGIICSLKKTDRDVKSGKLDAGEAIEQVALRLTCSN